MAIVSHDVFFNGQPCKMVMVTDMTAVVRNEEKLREAYEKEKALHNELAANMSGSKKPNRRAAKWPR